jgi:hypothetical protein
MRVDLCLNTDFFTDKTRPKYTSQPFTLHCNKKFIHAAGDHHWSRQNIRLVRTATDFYEGKGDGRTIGNNGLQLYLPDHATFEFSNLQMLEVVVVRREKLFGWS